MRNISWTVSIFVLLINAGCPSTKITARNLDPKSHERAGIPFYLPKPYLVVAKNVRYIATPTVGLTAPSPIPDSFDANAREATISSTINQGRQLDLERKLLEESKFERTEKDILEQKIEQKFERLEEEKFQQTVEDKFQRLEEDKRNFEHNFQRLEEDKRSIEERVEDLENKTTTTTATSANTSTNTNTTSSSTTNATTNANTNTGANTGTTTTVTQAEGNAPAAAPSPSGVARVENTDAPTSGVATNRQVLGTTNQEVVPSDQIPDGLTPETFYTYQIVYLPDLTQKYGLEIRQGTGEFRGTMNLVNGWMHTGVGPMYMKDSTKAAQTLASGAAIGNVIDSIAGLSMASAGSKLPGATGAPIKSIIPTMGAGQTETQSDRSSRTHTLEKVPDYAELYIFEPVLEECHGRKEVHWRLLTATALGTTRPWIHMDRHFIATTTGGGGTVDRGGATGGSMSDVRDYMLAELKKKPGVTDVTLDPEDNGRIVFRISDPKEVGGIVAAVMAAANQRYKDDPTAQKNISTVAFGCLNCR